MFIKGCRMIFRFACNESIKLVIFSKTLLESRAKEGDSPVCENYHNFIILFLSTARPEKSRRNLAGLSAKAKYFL